MEMQSANINSSVEEARASVPRDMLGNDLVTRGL
jgi:hypothetical protein